MNSVCPLMDQSVRICSRLLTRFRLRIAVKICTQIWFSVISFSLLTAVCSLDLKLLLMPSLRDAFTQAFFLYKEKLVNLSLLVSFNMGLIKSVHWIELSSISRTAFFPLMPQKANRGKRQAVIKPKKHLMLSVPSWELLQLPVRLWAAE